MKKHITLLFAIVGMLSNTLFAATKTSTGSGNWTTAGTWTPSGAPSAGDVINIEAGHTITVSSVVNISSGAAVTVNIRGTLTFSGGGSKLRLATGSVINLLSGGNITTSGGGGGGSQTIEAGGTGLWNTSMGNFSGPKTITEASPLPVVWLSFTGNRMPNGTVQLNWSTASELSNSHFEVEKTTDGKTFTKLNEVKGNGTTNKISKYSYTDKQPGTATVYYRLKQVDFNSKFEYSKLVAVKGANNSTASSSGGNNSGGGSKGGQGTTGQTKENVMVVKPVAIIDIAQFKIDGQDKADVIVELVNPKGKVVVSKNTILFGGAARIDLSDAPKGVYKMVVRLASDKTKIGSANVVKK